MLADAFDQPGPFNDPRRMRPLQQTGRRPMAYNDLPPGGFPINSGGFGGGGRMNQLLRQMPPEVKAMLRERIGGMQGSPEQKRAMMRQALQGILDDPNVQAQIANEGNQMPPGGMTSTQLPGGGGVLGVPGPGPQPTPAPTGGSADLVDQAAGDLAAPGGPPPGTDPAEPAPGGGPAPDGGPAGGPWNPYADPTFLGNWKKANTLLSTLDPEQQKAIRAGYQTADPGQYRRLNAFREQLLKAGYDPGFDAMSWPGSQPPGPGPAPDGGPAAETKPGGFPQQDGGPASGGGGSMTDRARRGKWTGGTAMPPPPPGTVNLTGGASGNLKSGLGRRVSNAGRLDKPPTSAEVGAATGNPGQMASLRKKKQMARRGGGGMKPPTFTTNV